MKKITELTAELAAPAIAEQGCTLWDVVLQHQDFR